MKRLFFILVAAMSVAMCNIGTPKTVPEAIKGTWSGEIDVMGLALVLHLGDTCSADSPDQGAYGLPARIVKAGDASVTVKLPGVGAKFTGTLQGDSLIGTFSQMGIKAHLPMGRGPIVRNRPQTPKGPFPYGTEEVSFCNGDISLAGTLALPEQTGTAVVMVSGSGMQDRDETIMEHKPFAVLADGLARAGISSLRYDDRECGGSTGKFDDATTADFAKDAAAAVRYLRSRGYGKVGIIGHSEGGTIAFMLAGAETPDDGTPDFIVSLAGMADRGDSTLLRQTAKMLALNGAPQKAANFAAKALYRQTSKKANTWMKYFIELDPAPYLGRIQCPVLALNGDKDSQVIPEFNLSKVQALCPAADCRLYPGLNHLFQHCNTGLSTEYARIEESFSEEAMGDIIAWIGKL